MWPKAYRSLLFLLMTMAWSLPVSARDLQTFDLDLGGSVVRIPVPEGYERASQVNPVMFARAAGAMPRGMRWEELLMPSGENEIDDPFAPPSIEILVREDDIGRVLTDEQWAEERDSVIGAQATLDVSDLVEQAERKGNQALQAAGAVSRYRAAPTGILELIEDDDPRLLRHIGIRNATLMQGERQAELTSVRISTIIHINQRLLYIAVESLFPENQPRPWRVIEATDKYIEQLYRANP